MNNKIYKQIITSIAAYKNCLNSDKLNTKWEEHWKNKIEYIEDNFLPSGSGIDNGNKIDIDKSNENRLIINSSFHLMDNNGYYDRWINYKVIIKSSLLYEISLNIVGNFGKDQELKDYLIEIYEDSLMHKLPKNIYNKMEKTLRDEK